MGIILVGLNHRTAPVEVRERLAFGEQTLEPALRGLVDNQNISEAVIVSTCNRVEIVAATPAPSPDAVDRVFSFISDFHRLGKVPEKHLYAHIDQTAVRHLFRVASSLDSMVVGEPQILGQVKTAYTRAVEVGTVGKVLNQLMTRAFTVAKRVRTETEIGSNVTSISSVAVDLARKVFDQLKDKCVMLVGAGEMVESAAKHLMSEGVKNFLICNRTPERAKELVATFGGEAVEFSRLSSNLSRADIVICSTGAPNYVITANDCKKAIESRRFRPIFFIDISVPRNIDPDVSRLENHFLFDIDDLEGVVGENMRQRQREALKAETIIEHEVESFFERMEVVDIGPTVSALREHINEMVLNEFNRLRSKLGKLTPEQEEAIKQILLSSVVNKFMHPLITSLREGARSNGNGVDIIELYKNVYNLKGRIERQFQDEDV
ncbi:MAG: glutamyl-tRNA reductase [Blastocatellia bacterium]|nr:glutamyl-tRNA reductase [Blastocatellia bacterium]